MPNESNVTQPLTLIAPGRSGTSLVSNILGAHPDVDFVGETGLMLVKTWDGVCRMKGISAPQKRGYEDLAGDVVRDACCTLWPTEAKYWMQKPVNISSFSFGWRREEKGWDSTIKWYWRMMIKTFPAAKFFTILRDPRDIVASQMERFGTTVRATWQIVASQYEMLGHEACPVFDAIVYEDLRDNTDQEVLKLLDLLGLPYHNACWQAAKLVYVPGSRKNLSEIKKHRDWSNIGEPSFLQKRHINTAFEKYGREGVL